jgi:hypothetical protein
MEKKIVFTAEMAGSDAVLKQMAELRDANAGLTNETKVYQAAAKNGIKITEEERIANEKRLVQVKENRTQINELTKAYQGQEQKVESLAPKLEKLRNEMARLALEGKKGTSEFKKMRDEAARMQDTIDKTQKEIRYFADDLAGLKAGVATLSAVSAGFQAVTGVMAIAGVESEEFEKMLLKVQGAMAVTNSLQQITNALRVEGSIRLGAYSLLTKAQAVAAGVATAATWVWNAAIVAFNTTVYNIPVLGWLLAIIGAIIAVIVIAVKWIGRISSETKEWIGQVETLEERYARLNKEMAKNIDQLQHQIKLMKAQGKSTDEITAKERELLKLRVDMARVELYRAVQNKELAEEEKKKAQDAFRNAKRELELFDETEKTKARLLREEDARRREEQKKADDERRNEEREAEVAFLLATNTEYIELERQLEEERAAMRVENYRKRTALREKEKQESIKRLEEEKKAAETKAKHDAQMLEQERAMQAMRVTSSIAATGQLVTNLGALMGAESKAAKWAQILAIAESAVNFGVGLSATMRKGLPLSVPFVIGFAAQAAGILAQIKNMIVPSAPKLAKGGIIGGKSHSQGGTTFRGTDGSVFEAERGEYLAIVNKHDATRAAMLDAINQEHGVSFGKTSGYFARGGVQMPQPRSDFERTNTDDIIRETVAAISMIPVVVSEKDITDTQRIVRVYEDAGNL